MVAIPKVLLRHFSWAPPPLLHRRTLNPSRARLPPPPPPHPIGSSQELLLLLLQETSLETFSAGWLSMQFSQPFTVGDTIKVCARGWICRTAEKFPVIVPNSLFSSQAIVNKSRVEWRAIITNAPLTMNSLDKVANVSSDVKSMFEKYEQNFMLKEPYCFLSGIGSSSAELTIAYSLKYMGKDQLYSMEQDILLQFGRDN